MLRHLFRTKRKPRAKKGKTRKQHIHKVPATVHVPVPSHKANADKTFNCNPKIGNGAIANTCITKHVLLRIRDEYNKDHPSQPIQGTHGPVELYNELKKRLQCDHEKCMLKEIDDSAERAKYAAELFAPEHPKEWDKNPNEWLSNEDIDKVIAQYESKYPDFKYLGTSAIDYDFKYSDGNCVENRLCKFDLKNSIGEGKKRFGAVFNLDKHNERGSHWVSFFVKVDPSKKQGWICFFDSATSSKGVKDLDKLVKSDAMPAEVANLIQTIIKQGANIGYRFHWQMNRRQHQQGNSECGMYSLYFIIHMLENSEKTLKCIQNHRLSDADVEKYRKIYFNGPSESV